MFAWEKCYCRESLSACASPSAGLPRPAQPSWNPAVDAQAVDRTHRVGQHKPVVTYRLLSCGSIEEQVRRGATGCTSGPCTILLLLPLY